VPFNRQTGVRNTPGIYSDEGLVELATQELLGFIAGSMRVRGVDRLYDANRDGRENLRGAGNEKGVRRGSEAHDLLRTQKAVRGGRLHGAG
jgi:hypothetical protein